MREGIPSVTAGSVAFARAATIDDPVARRLFPWAFGGLAARLGSFGLVDHIALRTAAIDELLAPGFPQLVLLGAGLDARAYRLESLAHARVFEVDHPDSQRLKLRFARGLEPIAESVTSIAADFLVDDLDALLANAGHDAHAPTAWIMEGVALYLPIAITRKVLAAAAARSAGGSIIAVTYLHRRRISLLPLLGGTVLRAIGEPLGDAFSRTQAAELLTKAGWAPTSDTNDVDWSRRFGYSAKLARIFRDDLRRAPCLACDELVAVRDVYKDTRHLHRSCCSWHAYHFWCTREEAGWRVGFDECAECRAKIAVDVVDEMLNWRDATFENRLHSFSHELPRPQAYRFRLVRRVVTPGHVRPPRPVPLFHRDTLEGARESRFWSRGRLELVHDSCARDPEIAKWLPTLATAEGRAVFMDLQEERATPVMELARLAARRHEKDVETRLRAIAAGLPSSMVRTILKLYGGVASPPNATFS